MSYATAVSATTPQEAMFSRRVNVQQLTAELREDLHQAHIEAGVEIGEGIMRIVRGKPPIAPTIPVSTTKPRKRPWFRLAR